MNTTKWLACTALAGGLVVAGCGGGGTTDGGATDSGGHDGGGMDAGPCDPTASGMTYFYVVNVLQLPQPAGPTGDVIDGFNLDGNSDLVCGVMDFTGPDFLGSQPGVDNALAPFLGSLANTSIQQSVDQGKVVILLEVKGVDNFMNDTCISATAYLGKLPTGVTMPMVGADMRITPGQTFDVDANSFSDMAHTMPRITFASAQILNGRVHAGPADFPISLDFMGNPLSLTIKQAQLDFGISATAVTNGVLGGAINDAQLLATIAAIPSLCSYVGTVGPILDMNSDLMPDSTGMHCAEASIAIDLSGVTAVKGMVVTTPATDAGMPMGCGTMDGGAHDGGGGGDAGPHDAGTSTDASTSG